jgi:hypothetical protein
MARPGLDRHVKFRLLVRLLGEPEAHVRGYLECLWDVAYENGEPLIGDSDAVEAAAKYPGERGRLFNALLRCGGSGRDGFIESVHGCADMYKVHDLFDHAPEYVQKRRKREEERRAKVAADNGGQRPPPADNGAPPAPAPAQKRVAAHAAARPKETSDQLLKTSSDGTAAKPKDPASAEVKAHTRARDELFDALVEVTGSDPQLNGSHLGRACKALRDADPPYTAAEVRRLAEIVPTEFPWVEGRITIGFVTKYVPAVRAGPSGHPGRPGNGQPAETPQQHEARVQAERAEEVRRRAEAAQVPSMRAKSRRPAGGTP